MNVRSFTDEDKKWLIANYPHLTKKKCMSHLKCGRVAIDKLMQECGIEPRLYTERQPQPQKEVTFIWTDKGCVRYCMDCREYRKDGICQKTGKTIGALWQKRCFKIGR